MENYSINILVVHGDNIIDRMKLIGTLITRQSVYYRHADIPYTLCMTEVSSNIANCILFDCKIMHGEFTLPRSIQLWMCSYQSLPTVIIDTELNVSTLIVHYSAETSADQLAKINEMMVKSSVIQTTARDREIDLIVMYEETFVMCDHRPIRPYVFKLPAVPNSTEVSVHTMSLQRWFTLLFVRMIIPRTFDDPGDNPLHCILVVHHESDRQFVIDMLIQSSVHVIRDELDYQINYTRHASDSNTYVCTMDAGTRVYKVQKCLVKFCTYDNLPDVYNGDIYIGHTIYHYSMNTSVSDVNVTRQALDSRYKNNIDGRLLLLKTGDTRLRIIRAHKQESDYMHRLVRSRGDTVDVISYENAVEWMSSVIKCIKT